VLAEMSTRRGHARSATDSNLDRLQLEALHSPSSRRTRPASAGGGGATTHPTIHTIPTHARTTVPRRPSSALPTSGAGSPHKPSLPRPKSAHSTQSSLSRMPPVSPGKPLLVREAVFGRTVVVRPRSASPSAAGTPPRHGSVSSPSRPPSAAPSHHSWTNLGPMDSSASPKKPLVGLRTESASPHRSSHSQEPAASQVRRVSTLPILLPPAAAVW
jgi:hypothetical protein